MNTGLLLVPNQCPICGNKTLQEWNCHTISMNGSKETISTIQRYRCAGGHVFTPGNNPATQQPPRFLPLRYLQSQGMFLFVDELR
jgi:hypothetical protein